MTAEKHFKRLVRARMDEAGLTYSQARTALLAEQRSIDLSEPLTVDVHGRHGQVVTFTPDGSRLLSGGQDARIHVLDPASGELTGSLVGHEQVVNDLALTPDGRRLVSVSSDRSVRLWDVARQQQERVLTGHRDAVVTVSIAPDGATALTSGYDGRILGWDLSDGSLVSEVKSSLRRVGALRHTPDGRHVVEAGQGSAVLVRDSTTGEVVQELDSGSAGVVGLAVSPDGRIIATGGSDGAICLWATDDFSLIRRMTVGSTVGALAISRSGQLLGAAGGGRVSLWSFDSEEAVTSTQLPIKGVYALCFSPDGRRLAQTGADGKVRIWRLR